MSLDKITPKPVWAKPNEQGADFSMAPEDWKTIGALKEEMGSDPRTIGRLLEEYLKESGESGVSFKMRVIRDNKLCAGRAETHYSPKAIQYVKDHILPIAPDEWKTSRGTADGSNDVLAQRLFDEYVEKHGSQHVRNYRTQATKNNKLIGGQVNQHYSPEAVAHVKEHLSKIPPIAPDEWITRRALARELQRGPEIIQKTLDDFVSKSGPQHMREFRLRRERAGKVLPGTVEPHYSLEAAAYVREQLSAVPEAPDEWKTLSALVDELKYGPKLVGPLLTEYVKEHGAEHSRSYRKKKIRDEKIVFGEAATHYSPEAAAFVKESLSDISIVPEGWKTISAMAEEENETEPRIATYLNDFVEKNGAVHRRKFQASVQRQSRTIAGRIQNYYSPGAVAYAKDRIKAIPIAPDDWLPITTTTKQTGLSYGTVQTMLDRYVSEHGEQHKREMRMRRTRKGEVVGGEALPHYSPEAIASLKDELADVPVAPNGWKTINGLSEFGGADRVEYFLKEFVERNGAQHLHDYRASTSHEGRIRKGKVLPHYSPKAVEYATAKLTEIPFAPSDWKTSGAITVENGLTGHEVTRRMLDRFVAEHGSQHMREYRTLRVRGDKEVGGPVFDHFSPEAARFIRDYYHQKDVEAEKIKNANEGLNSFFENSGDLKEFQVLVGLFGSAQVIDVLYALRPEFKDIPPEQVKGMIAEYLGSHLLSPVPFEADNLEKALVHLKNNSLREGLREVIKSDCLHAALKVKKHNPTISEKDLFTNYFTDLRKRCARYQSPELQQTLSEVETYYHSVLEDFTKPSSRMVDSLKADRKFPDLYQKINVKEIADKKRVLIADEMGVGKSASAILAKEELGVKTALIIAPSNVEATWRSYLSDKVNEDGKQIGYFRRGQAPRVLVIESQKDLSRIESDTYDYIFISQEKLNEQKYVDALSQSDFDMLIVDEIHELKNVRTGKRSSALIELTDKIQGENQYLALLSGTPVPNKVEDVAILLKMLHPERFADVTARQMIPEIIHGNIADLRTLLVPRMQMKSLAENVNMPKLTEKIVRIPLTKAEKEIYQVLLDEDELTSVEKMHVLRQFLVNPALLNVLPNTPCSKLVALKTELADAFNQHDKVLVFVNDYISDVIRGENSILEQLDLPSGVSIQSVHGGTSEAQRQVIQESFNKKNGKMLLVVSGSTAGVGVDYSGADHLIFYNEPWTKAEKNQQQARPYRPGLAHDLTSVTFLAENTIDEGINRYIEAKYRAIEKLLKGIPTTEFEQELLTKAEVAPDQSLEVNADLAKYYFSVFDKMNRIFGSVKQIGEKRFQEFLEKRGQEYADYYLALGGRSYQANSGRVCAALIQQMIKEQGKENPRVLDLGSGPEMLRRHAQERVQSNIISTDINPAHFIGRADRGAAVVASYAQMPFADNSFDYVNMSLVLHHTKFVPSKSEFERVTVLAELSRMLKTDGRGIINEMYSLDIKDPSKLPEVLDQFGLKVVPDYTGEVQAGDTYMSRVITVEKVRDVSNVEEQIAKMSRELHDGLKFKETKDALKNRRRIISKFKIGTKEVNIPLNTRDRMLLEAEQEILRDGEELKRKYGSIEAIPKQDVISHGFTRVQLGKRYILFKETDGSAIVVK